MSDVEIGPGGPAIPVGTLNGITAGTDTILPGTPLIAEAPGGGYGPQLTGLAAAIATTSGGRAVIGLALNPANVGGVRVNFRASGALTLTEAQWAAVLDTGTELTQGAVYFLSTTKGKITVTPPIAAGNYETIIGIALSPTSMLMTLTPGALAHT